MMDKIKSKGKTINMKTYKSHGPFSWSNQMLNHINIKDKAYRIRYFVLRYSEPFSNIEVN